mgnify:CR=1 FL=1
MFSISAKPLHARNSSRDLKTDAAVRKRVSLRAFARDERGNLAILFTFMSVMLFLFVGGAVDYSRWNAVRADMVESMDAASLAVAQLAAADDSISKADLKDYGKRFFEENFNYETHLKSGWDIDFDLADEAVISTCITGAVDTYLLGVAGIDKLNIDNCVEITKKGSGRIELALVLDVTGSMDWYNGGEKKIDSLKDAVDNLLAVMYGEATTSNNLKIGVVPFNAYVNAGGASSWQSSWGDLNAQSAYHGAHFIHVDETGIVDNSSLAKDYNDSGIAKVMDVSRKVNHYDLYNSHSNLSWKGCVEARPYPLDELDTPVGAATTSTFINNAISTPSELNSPGNDYETRMKAAFTAKPSLMLSASDLAQAGNSYFVPLFHPDEPDCDDDACDWGDSEVTKTYSMGGASRTVSGYGFFFDNPDDASGIDDKDYKNRDLVSDYRFTASNQGEDFSRYLEVVLGARMAIDEDYSDLDSYWDGVKARLFDLGATKISDTETVCSKKKKKKKKSCTTTTETGDEFILRNSYVGWWDSSAGKYKGKYDQSPNSGSDPSPNLNCPKEILPLTNDRTAIENHVDALSAHGNTDSANGAMWGWRILSNGAPFTEGVPDSNTDWTKAIVIMTDGENTVGSADTHWDSAPTSYGYAVESRMGVGVNSASEMRDEVDNKLLRICHRMKQEGYLVYTIMFDLDSTSVETIFKACATKPTAPYFQDADTGTDLEQAFGDIAKDLVDLHVSK